MGIVTLTLPAHAEYVAIARSVAAGIAAKASMTLDDIEDVRLAVDEACAHLLSSTSSERLTLEVSRDEGLLQIAARVDGAIDAVPANDDGAIAWRSLETLADSVRLERDGTSAVIRMAKRIA